MEAPTPAWSWSSAFAGAVLASIVSILGYLLKRKKLPSDINKTNADADLTREQAADLRFHRRLQATEMLDEMEAMIGELRFQKMQLKEELLTERERNRILEVEVQRFKAVRKLNQLNGK